MNGGRKKEIAAVNRAAVHGMIGKFEKRVVYRSGLDAVKRLRRSPEEHVCTKSGGMCLLSPVRALQGLLLLDFDFLDQR
jgi:hypothetical protein